MRLRNPRVQLIIALAVLLIVLSAISYSKVWPKQENMEPEAVSAPVITHPDTPIVSVAPTSPVIATNTENVNTYPTEHIDVVVIGSELEGLYLARAAADEGLKVKV
jgi:hypothetical protein